MRRVKKPPIVCEDGFYIFEKPTLFSNQGIFVLNKQEAEEVKGLMRDIITEEIARFRAIAN